MKSYLTIGALALALGGTGFLVLEARNGDSGPLTLVRAATAADNTEALVQNFLREGWRTDFSKVNVDMGDILSGGPPRDGIPSIDNPKFVPVGSAELDLVDREPVISLVVNGEAKAYPLRVMMWHEIANDEIGGMPVAVTYCPLCNASIVFDATVDGRALAFGTTGKLRNSDLIMYDRETETWWQQFSGEAIVGDLVGTKLTMLPSRLDSWKRFREEHPDGQVLVPNDEQMRAYWRNPYTGYDSSAAPFLYRGTLPDGIRALERVILVRDGDTEPFALSLPLLEAEKRIEQNGVVLTWEPGQASALDTSAIAEGRDVGNVAVYRMVDGSRKPVVHDVTFAFVVAAFEPTLVIRTD